tara:strand:+ start:1712 stop:2857 length:1146 start_codon:yes stop_codon:yes gene_type:complete
MQSNNDNAPSTATTSSPQDDVTILRTQLDDERVINDQYQQEVAALRQQLRAYKGVVSNISITQSLRSGEWPMTHSGKLRSCAVDALKTENELLKQQLQHEKNLRMLAENEASLNKKDAEQARATDIADRMAVRMSAYTPAEVTQQIQLDRQAHEIDDLKHRLNMTERQLQHSRKFVEFTSFSTVSPDDDTALLLLKYANDEIHHANKEIGRLTDQTNSNGAIIQRQEQLLRDYEGLEQHARQLSRAAWEWKAHAELLEQKLNDVVPLLSNWTAAVVIPPGWMSQSENPGANNAMVSSPELNRHVPTKIKKIHTDTNKQVQPNELYTPIRYPTRDTKQTLKVIKDKAFWKQHKVVFNSTKSPAKGHRRRERSKNSGKKLRTW